MRALHSYDTEDGSERPRGHQARTLFGLDSLPLAPPPDESGLGRQARAGQARVHVCTCATTPRDLSCRAHPAARVGRRRGQLTLLNESITFTTIVHSWQRSVQLIQHSTGGLYRTLPSVHYICDRGPVSQTRNKHRKVCQRAATSRQDSRRRRYGEGPM